MIVELLVFFHNDKLYCKEAGIKPVYVDFLLEYRYYVQWYAVSIEVQCMFMMGIIGGR